MYGARLKQSIEENFFCQPRLSINRSSCSRDTVEASCSSFLSHFKRPFLFKACCAIVCLSRSCNLLLRRKLRPQSSRISHCLTSVAMASIATEQANIQSDAAFPIFVYGNHAHEILASHDREFKLPEGGVLLRQGEGTSFQEDNFKSHLYFQTANTLQFGTQLVWSPRLPSTHTLLSQNFHAFPLGTVCVADTQVSGKGRSSNKWESPKGCLMFSFTLQMHNGHMLPFLQYVVSIALIDAIHHVTLLKELPILPVKIKWPNDIYANDVKIGGVLCTSTYRDKKFDVVAGIGLNVGNRNPTTCLDALLQEAVSEAPLYKREELLAAFFVKFETLFQRFNSEGFGPLQSSYYEKWLHSEQEVVLEERQQDNSTRRVSLTIKGLSPTGYLLATDDQMEAYELHPDGNSFDFLKGLVRTKLQP